MFLPLIRSINLSNSAAQRAGSDEANPANALRLVEIFSAFVTLAPMVVSDVDAMSEKF